MMADIVFRGLMEERKMRLEAKHAAESDRLIDEMIRGWEREEHLQDLRKEESDVDRSRDLSEAAEEDARKAYLRSIDDRSRRTRHED